MEGLGDGYEAFVERMRFDIASSTSSAPKPRPPPPPPPVPSSSAAASAALPPSSSSSSSSSPYQRYVGYPSTSNAFTVKREAGVPSSEGGGGASADAPLPPSSPEGGGGGGGGGGGRFSSDLNRMPDAPPRTGSHRRAQSEIAFRLPDDLLFEPEPEPEHEHGLGLGLGSDHLPSQSDELWDDFLGSYYYDAEHIAPPGGSSSTSCSNQNDALNTFRHPGGHHSRSLSMDGMAALGFGHSLMPGGKGASSGNSAPSSRHHHSYSMDGSSNYFKHDGLSGDLESVESKKALAAKKLAEIALVDPKRAKRILANRQSAARSKERKMRYIAELECKVQTLQTEATTLSAQLTLLQRDTTGLTSENGELRVRLQSLEQQTQLRDALQDALKEEIQRLKLASAQLSALNGGPAFNLSTPPHVPLAKQFGPGSQYSQHLANQAQGKGGSFGNSLFKQEGGTSSGGSGNLNNVSHSQAL